MMGYLDVKFPVRISAGVVVCALLCVMSKIPYPSELSRIPASQSRTVSRLL